MKFLDNDFSRMRYKVHPVPDDNDILKEIPELKSIPSLADIEPIRKGLIRTQIIKYIAYMYDPSTPVLSVPDIMKRRFFAAKLAGFSQDKRRRFTKPVEDMISGKDELVNRAITEFVVSFNKAKYTKLVVYQTAYERQMEVLLEGKYKADVIGIVDDLEAGISNIVKILANQDTAQFVIDDLYEKVRDDQLRLRPEDIVEKIENREELVDVHPYGEDYKFEQNEWKGVKLLSPIAGKKGL